MQKRGIVMTIKELRQFFNDHLVPEKLYSLNGNHKNRICLEKSDDGWDLYFSDHKVKVGLLHYPTEAEACIGMKAEIHKIMRSIYGLSWANTPV